MQIFGKEDNRSDFGPSPVTISKGSRQLSVVEYVGGAEQTPFVYLYTRLS